MHEGTSSKFSQCGNFEAFCVSPIIDALKIANRGKYAAYVRDLHKVETQKAYPSRYPYNSDSIGIEVSGKYDEKAQAYVSATAAQKSSVIRLISGLKKKFNLTDKDVYRHGEISYKDAQRTEGRDLGY